MTYLNRVQVVNKTLDI